MRLTAPTLVFVLAGAVALPIVIDAQSTPATARSETRIQLGDLLLDDQRYWESILVYEQAKDGASEQQLVRASAGMLEGLLHVAEFTRAMQEAESLGRLGPLSPATRVLTGDALWSAGLFDEAEEVYRDVLALHPESGGARNGLAKSLATRHQFGEALDWAEAALEVSPDLGTFHHTLGSIYQRMHRYPEAADAYERYVDLLAAHTPNTEKEGWARADIRFLRSFGDRPAVQISDPGRVHTIPFRLVRDKVIVRGRVNGQQAVDFVIDTGAEQTVLSQDVARRLGVQPITNTLSAGVGEYGLRGLQEGRIDTLQIGSLEGRQSAGPDQEPGDRRFAHPGVRGVFAARARAVDDD